MNAIFIELPAFERTRQDYLNNEAFRKLQSVLMQNPKAGDLIQETGGLRKIRFTDGKRQMGKRGGIRVIYYWWSQGAQFWFFTLYGKDEQDDLNPLQKRTLKHLLHIEIEARRRHET